MQRSTVLCLAAACLFSMLLWQASAYTPSKDYRSGQLSPSVLLMGEFDWTLSTGRDGKPWSHCLDMVWRARAVSNGNKLNFVPTHHWMPNSNGLGVASYCYMHTSGAVGDKGSCLPWTPEKLAEFKKSMTLCFTEAFKQGFVPYVRPHLDDGLNRGIWRNSLLFSPTVKYGSYSYADVMLTPLSEAMRDAIAAAAKLGDLYMPPEAARPVVYMALQGEMSATLMRYTDAWATLVPVVKDTIGSSYADVKVGAGLNFNALDAVEGATNSASTGLFGALLGGVTGQTNPSAPPIQAANVNNLLSNGLDFLGISAYAPYTGANFGITEFQNSAFNVGNALATLANGVSLSSLAKSGKLELHYSEFGVGGGVNGLAEIAASADACAKQPWAGIIGSYSSSMDPWKRSDLSAFRDSFYDRAIGWLSSPGSATYDIKEVFVWCMASWDVFGIYPDSSSPSGSYKDMSVLKSIAAHDTAVIAAQVCKYEGATACSVFYNDNKACLLDTTGTACLDRSSSSKPPSVVTEAGPAQPPSSPAPGIENPAPTTGSAGGSGTTDTPATEDDELAPMNGSYVDMAPDATAAAPAPAASVASPSPVTTTKNSASQRQLAWSLLLSAPAVCLILLFGL